MRTNNIKTFAQKARLILLDGVSNRLKYWGFDDDGSCKVNLDSTAGGYSFRGEVYNDPSVPAKWNKLKNRLTDRQSVEDVIEEAAYTWFNRLMAVKILESNGYLPKQMEYVSGTRTPMIVQNAKRGQHDLQQKSFIELLQQHILEDREEQALGLLLVRLCNNHQLLHNVFGRIDDYTEILLPQNLLQRDGMMDLINSELVSPEDYKEVELIGWLYQFYISDRKNRVFADFKKNKKARAQDIPAATQIFTPKWIVKYMVENTVGKLYLDYEPSSTIKEDMKYLVENENEQKTPPIISDITELTLLDPAAGSGHILVTGFDLLFQMYKQEGYASKQAVENILKHNLWGLDIDDRAVQLARFAVLLKAAKYDEGILSKSVIPHIYSFPEAEHFTTEELHTFLGSDGLDYVAELKDALELLNQGKNIGSALKFDLGEQCTDFIKSRYLHIADKEASSALDFENQVVWYRLKPFLDVLLVMTRKYTAVVANPPYMGQKNMNASLKEYVGKHYPISKSDLFAVFMEVCLGLGTKNGFMGMINQHSWMFLSSFEKLRDKVIDNFGIVSMLHLGPRTFEELSGEVVQSTAFVIQNGQDIQKGTYYRLVDYRNNREKESNFLKGNNIYPYIPQSNFSKIPGNPIAYWVSERVFLIFDNYNKVVHIGKPKQGIATGNNDLFLKFWHEININMFSEISQCQERAYWFPYRKGGGSRKWYGNNELVLLWKDNGFEIKNYKNDKGQLQSRPQNLDFALKEGLTWSLTNSGGFSIRYAPEGQFFDINGMTLFIDNKKDQFFYLELLNCVCANVFLKIINPTMAFQAGDIGKIPIVDISSEGIIGYSNYIVSKEDWDSRETSWDFQKSPLLNETKSINQAYTKWFQEVSNDFFQLHANEEKLNRIFINIYGLLDELTPDVPLKDITILQDELNPDGLKQLEPTFRKYGKDSIELPIKKEEVLSQFVSYCMGLMMGRYRLDKPGLNIAHPNPSEEETASYQYNGHTIDIDDNAIVPLMGKDCAFSDDALIRLKNIMLATWGEDTLIDNLNFLQDGLGTTPHKWLTEKFWNYHTRMYKKKPIYWLFTSNPKQPHQAGFKVLTYMHRMDRFTVQQIQRNYLHPHQEYINREIDKLKEHEDTLSKQEVKRLEALQKWEVECRNYNEVLKDLANQQIEFDLDDGVSVNYAKFDGAVAII